MIRHKSWVADVDRMRGEKVSRHGKLRLDKNERVTPFPEDFLAALRASITSDVISAYPETEQLYTTLADHLGVGVDNLMLTAGSDAAIRHCFDLFVRPGDEVIVMEPTFAMVDVYCALFAARRRAVGYDADLRLDTEKLLMSIGAATALVVVANPNSPTGTLIDTCELEAVLARAMQFDVPVLVDEAYYGFCRHTALPLVARYPNLIVSRTFSKAAGLAGLRVGYLVATNELAQLLYRFRPMYEVNAVGVLAALQVLRQPRLSEDYLAATEAGRRLLLDFLAPRHVPYRDTHTNFVHIDFGAKKALAAAAFQEADVLIRGGLNVPGYEGYLRITIGPEPAMTVVTDVIGHILVEAAQ